MTLGWLVDGLLDRGCRVQVFRPGQAVEDLPASNGLYREHLLPGMRIPRYPQLQFGFPAGRRLRWIWRETRPHAVYVATEGPNARLVPTGDGPMRETLAQNNPDFVFCGMRRGKDLARHYASGDLFLFASQTETFGNVVTEAMSSGLAVLAYNRPAAREYIRDDHNGALAVDHSERAFIERATLVCGNYLPELTAPLARFSALVALSRPVLGLHYPSDVVAGAAIGTLVGVVALQLPSFV